MLIAAGKGMALDINPAALGNWVLDFVRINNRISGITRDPTAAELGAHRGLLARNALGVENLEIFVHHIAKGAGWRSDDRPGSEERSEDGAWVEELKADLSTIILAAQRQTASPPRLHQIFSLLRPFTDGNGRCGRALFMWQVLRRSAPYGVAGAEDPHMFEAKSPVTLPPVARASLLS